MSELDYQSPWMLVPVITAVLLALVALMVWRKGRPFAAGAVFRSG